MLNHSFKFLLLAAILIINSTCVKLQKGTIFLKSVTLDQEQSFKVDINSAIKSELVLTQSSKIHIEAKLAFSTDRFQPQFFSFRLRHAQHQNLTEPVLAVYDGQQQSFNAVIDLGDPKHIKPFSGDYKLQIIVSDDKLDQNVRRFIANCKITFRVSMEDAGISDLHYQIPSLILTDPPAVRVDPPRIFITFIDVLILALFAIFIYGLIYLKVNINLFPTQSAGLISNALFLGVFGLILVFLFKFWLTWTFLETLKYFLIIIVPTALVANYAFIHIKKQ